MTYSIDFRRQALLIKEPDQLSLEATAKRFGESIECVSLVKTNRSAAYP